MSLNEITLEEAAKRTGRSKESIRRLIGKGEVQGRKVASRHGRFQWMVDASTLPSPDPHTIEAQEAHEAQEPQTLPAIPQERLLATLEAIATKADVENIIRAVDELSHNHDTYQQVSEERDRLETALGEALERVRELEGELAEAKRSRPWWRRKR